jgi:hypothetical protein
MGRLKSVSHNFIDLLLGFFAEPSASADDAPNVRMNWRH